MSDDTTVSKSERADIENKPKESELDGKISEDSTYQTTNNSEANISTPKEGSKRIPRKAQRTERIQDHPLLLTRDSEEDLLQTIPEVTMAKEKSAEENVANVTEMEESKKDVDELVKKSPKILKRISDLLRGICTLLKVFGGFALSIWSKLKKCLPSFLGVTFFLGILYGLDYFMIPLTYDDLPHYSARLQYISRMSALGLFPIIFSWFMGLSPVLARLVQSTLRDLVLMIVVHCALVTFLPIEQMHWIFMVMFVTVFFRLVQWFSICHDLPLLQTASEGPLQLCHITVTLYTFLSILAQELGYMQTPSITKPQTVDVGTDSPQWVYPTMCNVMQRLFCAASKPDHA